MPAPTRTWVIFLSWLGAAFRFRSLFGNHFHADEALFASWARLIAVWRDPLLLAQPVDKPPLLFYLQALAYPFFGPVEWAARLPNFIASLLLVPLVGVVAWRLYGDGLTAVVAAALVALSPLAIQFSATAFTDPLLTFWLVAAVALVASPALGPASRAYPALAGVAFGLAVATKYQAWLFLPLLVALAVLGRWSRRDWLRAAVGAGGVAVVLGAWLLARQGSGSLWALQIANAGGLRLAWSWELWPRLVAWGELWRVSLGWPVVLAAGLAVVVLTVAWVRAGRPRATLSPVDATLLLFVLAYSALNWLFAVPVWDRYLLPLLPLALILLARAVSGVARWLGAVFATTPRSSKPVAVSLTLALAGLLVMGAANARLGRFPVGGSPTADQGAWRVAATLRDKPYGTVLYDHWYSWHWRYQLFDTGVYVSWFPHAQALLDDLAVFAGDGAARYVVLPASGAADPVRRALRQAGYELVAEPVAGAAGADMGMILYRIVGAGP